MAKMTMADVRKMLGKASEPAVTDMTTLGEQLIAARAHLAELEQQYADQRAKVLADAADKPVQAAGATKPISKKG